jgi:hypothetical protein
VPAAADVDGACDITFNGVEVERIDSLSSPLELDAGAVLWFEGTDRAGTGTARVELIVASLTIDEATVAASDDGREFAASIDLEDITPYGVGLYRIRGRTDNCTATAWLRITGRTPFATVAGLTATGLLLGGLLGLGAALLARRRSTAWIATLSGFALGVGGSLLGQQLGRLELSWVSLGIIVGGSTLAAVLLGLAFTPRRPSRDEIRQRRALEERPVHSVVSEPAGAGRNRGEEGPPVALNLDAEDAVAVATSRDLGGLPVDVVEPEPGHEPEPADVVEPEPGHEPEPADVVEPESEHEPDLTLASPALTDHTDTGEALQPAETGEALEPAVPYDDAQPVAPDEDQAAAGGEPYWCYVMTTVDVVDLRDHTRVVARLEPGAWYLAKREAGGWAHIVSTGGGEGWVPSRSLHRQG